MKLVVGLGNPGEKYDGTRHNLGFAVLESLRKKHNLGDWENSKKFKAQVLQVSPELLLVRPQTYMNNSGQAVAAAANFYKIKPEDAVVIHDELDLPLGQIKIRIGGGFAGHHGVESVMESLGTDKFIRIRLGIGNLKTMQGERKAEHFSAEKFVLESFLQNERAKVKHMTKQTLEALDIILSQGLEKAQNQYN